MMMLIKIVTFFTNELLPQNSIRVKTDPTLIRFSLRFAWRVQFDALQNCLQLCKNPYVDNHC